MRSRPAIAQFRRVYRALEPPFAFSVTGVVYRPDDYADVVSALPQPVERSVQHSAPRGQRGKACNGHRSHALLAIEPLRLELRYGLETDESIHLVSAQQRSVEIRKISVLL